MEEIKKAKLKDLIQDDRNLNKGTELGQQLIEKSLRELGAGRSLLLDKNNRIIAGNKTHKNAEALGMEDVIIVETDGTKLVAVKRTDIDLDSQKGRKMAMADNVTTQVDLSWDTDELDAVAEDYDIALDEWDVGLDIEDLPQVTFPTGEKQGEGEGNSAEADAMDNKERTIHQRDPESEIIVANVSLFGTTEDMMLTQILSKEDADKLIALAKAEGADNLMKRIIAAL